MTFRDFLLIVFCLAVIAVAVLCIIALFYGTFIVWEAGHHYVAVFMAVYFVLAAVERSKE